MASFTYYQKEFAENGDTKEVPVSPSEGSVASYETGFPPETELKYDDPSSQDVEREEFNSILKGITGNIKYMQENGAFDFVAKELNGGIPIQYKKGATVIFDGLCYVSLENGNTDQDPFSSTKWLDTIKSINGMNYTIRQNEKAHALYRPISSFSLSQISIPNKDSVSIPGVSVNLKANTLYSISISMSFVFPGSSGIRIVPTFSTFPSVLAGNYTIIAESGSLQDNVGGVQVALAQSPGLHIVEPDTPSSLVGSFSADIMVRHNSDISLTMVAKLVGTASGSAATVRTLTIKAQKVD